MARRWTGIRRPVEELTLRRMERRRDEPPAEWWQRWNLLGDDWAREKADEEVKMRRLLKVLMEGRSDDEDRKAQHLAEALGLKDTLKNGGER